MRKSQQDQAVTTVMKTGAEIAPKRASGAREHSWAKKYVGVRVWLPVVVVMGIALAMAGAVRGQEAKQDAKIDFSNLNRLGDKASQTIDVALDEKMVRLASKFLSNSRSTTESKVKDIVSKLKGVYVRRFEFDRDGGFSEDDLKPILSQLSGPSWQRIVGVTSKKGHEDVRVYVMKQQDDIQGLAILAIQPRELTVVNIVGPIDIEKISELEIFGIPKLGLEPSSPKENPKQK